MPTKKEIEEFYRKLMNHPWFYLWANRHEIILDGVLAENEIRKLTTGAEIYEKMFEDFWNFNFFEGKKPELKDYMEMSL